MMSAGMPAIDLSQIKDPLARQGMVLLMNLVEEQGAEIQRLRAENQQLRDEIKRLKGEQGKPDIKANKQKDSPVHSSEKERRQPEAWEKGKKVPEIQINRTKVLEVNKSELPGDAEFKGYEEVVVQDVKVARDNILFRKEKYYSPSQRQSYLAPLPPGYEGQFGPGVRAFVPVLYFGCQMTEPKIVELLANFGVLISEGQVSNLLIHDQERFHDEKWELAKAGLLSSDWHLADSSSMRINGQNAYVHALANPWYTVFTTRWRKDRQTWLEVVQQCEKLRYRLNAEATPRPAIARPATGCEKLRYRLNAEALSLLAELGLSAEKQRHLAALLAGQGEHLEWSKEEFDAWLETYLPGLGPQQRQKVLDATGIAAYHAQTEWPVIGILGSDDAPEFNHLAAIHMLCWVHDGRHYTKLTPFLPHHQETLAAFRKDYWEFYRRLVAYQQMPNEDESQRLRTDFQELFTRKTDYRALDERIALTYAKQTQLLVALDHPQVPLHTNQVERDLRTWVRRRKISSGARTLAGAQAWDTFLSLAVTARKLGVSFYHYIYDRIAATNLLPSLAQLVTARTQVANQAQQALAPP
jgi:hypothetical protein